MTSLRRLHAVLAVPSLVLACALPACSSDDTLTTGDDELNYRSTAGQEFELSTEVTFTAKGLEGLEGDALREALDPQAKAVRNTVTTAIVAELDRIWPEDTRISYRGVAIQFRQDTASVRDVQHRDGSTWRMTVAGEFAGVQDLLAKLPLRTDGDQRYLPVTATVDGEAQELRVAVKPIASSLNAYPKYLDLFADGLDIGVHIGGDHNEPPMDIAHARSVYDDLVASGFDSPVGSFEALKADSGPLTRAITVKGEEVPVRVHLFHVDMTTPDTRQVLVDAFKESVLGDDVVIYDGHAGRRLDYSGVVLAYKPTRVSVPANVFPTLETTDKQQVYLFNGCETYTGYADELYKNPLRTPENTDVITTGNFSAIQPKANQVIAFIHAFIDGKTAADRTWRPRSWDSVLATMNAVGERSWVHVYGVHGLDDNPRISPLADEAKIDEACSSDADCGAPDTLCISVSSSSRVCGAACADTTGCPNGYTCGLPVGRSSIDDMQCSTR